MESSIWNQCLKSLELSLPPTELSTWIRPLQAMEQNGLLRLLAPNSFVMDQVNEKYYSLISETVTRLQQKPAQLVLEVGTLSSFIPEINSPSPHGDDREPAASVSFIRTSSIDEKNSFDAFVEGKSNQMAKAAAIQVSENPGVAYNPLFIYGGVGLGKTHLMQAIGNEMIRRSAKSRVVYLSAERFVTEMVKAVQHNAMNTFKQFYRTVDALLIDDIQFLAGKEKSQEEFFHTFNALIEAKRQIILTCDRYPKEVQGLEDRLKSRFGWGLTAAVEPPEFETRVAILMGKAAQGGIDLPPDVAFFIGKRIRSNIRELEGALKRVVANAKFSHKPITLELAKEALSDLLSILDRMVTIENIQKTVAEYYKIRVHDLLSPRRLQSITVPRQIAMALSKELTNHSLPEIGDAFGGRDHTTVIHATRRIKSLCESEARIHEEYQNLLRILTT